MDVLHLSVGDHPANHHGKFDFDEKALISGVRLMLTFVIV